LSSFHHDARRNSTRRGPAVCASSGVFSRCAELKMAKAVFPSFHPLYPLCFCWLEKDAVRNFPKQVIHWTIIDTQQELPTPLLAGYRQ
jgi:hypothetical protein